MILIVNLCKHLRVCTVGQPTGTDQSTKNWMENSETKTRTLSGKDKKSILYLLNQAVNCMYFYEEY